MKQLDFRLTLGFLLVLTFFSSCKMYNHTMKQVNTRVEFNRSDFILSDQVSAEATSTRILGFYFKRIFTKKTGDIQNPSTIGLLNYVSIPVIGDMAINKTSRYALYELMKKNKGYDVVFYPQYETKVSKPFLGMGFFYKKTTVKVTARLGKLFN